MKPSLHSIVISLLASMWSPVALWAAPPEAANSLKVIIRFKNAPGKSERDLVRNNGGTVNASFQIVPAVAATIPEAALEHLLLNPVIDVIEPDVETQAHASIEYNSVWGVTKIGGIAAHEGTYTGASAPQLGSGVKVAVCDSGIDYNHPELSPRYKGGYDFINNDSNPLDDNGHGTHVAGTIAAASNGTAIIGVAPEVDLYGLKVLGASGSGSFSAVISALDWCIANKIQVANFSLGSSTDPGTTVRAAFDRAATAGIVLICSAGNSGAGADTVGFPAKYTPCIAVASTTSSDSWSSFSSTGSGVDIAAPGSSIYSCRMGGGYTTMSGTSMAAPHAAGAAALLLGAGISDTNSNGLVNDEVRSLLQATAVDLGTAGFDNSFGHGRINVAAALVTLATGTIPTPPLFNAPSNLSGTFSGGSVNLNWTDNSNVETGFDVEYGKAGKRGTISWTLWSTTAADVTSFSGTLPSGTYSFRVRAKNGSSATAYSNTIQLKF